MKLTKIRGLLPHGKKAATLAGYSSKPMAVEATTALDTYHSNTIVKENEKPQVSDIKTLDIVDTQVHVGPGGIEETLASMDALGIRSILVDEYWITEPNFQPHETLPGGTIRPICPTAELAALKYPNRFSWVRRVERTDPEYAKIIQMTKDASSGRAIRLIPGMTLEETQAFSDGKYDEVLAEIEESGLPVFLFLPDHPELIAKTAKKFPKLKIIVDHCGLYSNGMRSMFGGAVPTRSKEEQLALFDEVLSLSKYPNLALKWSHSSEMFDIPVYPGTDLLPILKKAIDSFGADRIMWASDFSVNQRGENWSEILYGMKGIGLFDKELQAIIGGNARKWLN